MDLEEMKRQWADLDARMDKTETNTNNQKFDKMKTSQQQLANQYRMFGSLASVFSILSYTIFARIDINTWATAVFPIYFFVSAMMDFYLQRKIGEINLGTMSVTEVAQKAASCRKLHHIFQIILIPSAIILLTFLAYDMTGNKAFIYGMCIGGAIGLIFGLKTYFTFMDNYKSLIRG